VSVFPDEIEEVPRSWAERAYPKLIHYNKLDKGGHFAAWEQPQLFSEEIRAGFRPLQLIIYPDSGHGLHLQYPNLFLSHACCACFWTGDRNESRRFN
jgi:pimeloyl-ACP methyl ester carboxylesterase